MYCDLVFTGKIFNNHKVYKCQYCGLEAGIEGEDPQILCFKKQNDAYRSSLMYNFSKYPNVLEKNKDILFNEIINQQMRKEEKSYFSQNTNAISDNTEIEVSNEKLPTEDILCSKEQIDQRLDICNKCEYLRDNACMLCGCRIVREKNHQNKLANKNASCPAGKWGPIKNQIL